MALLFAMLPVYLLGNLHCLGMCGPLVMMIGRHRYRHLYFLGRATSFTLAGWIAGELGSVCHEVLSYYHIPAATCFLFGGSILLIGLYSLLGWHYPGYYWLAKRLSKTEKKLSLLMLRDQPWPTFLFGFFTLALPCGQTMVVFSACALSADGLVGMLNGFVFSILTSPSLWLAMNAQMFFRGLKQHYNLMMGGCAILVGLLSCCRGLAELGLISHFVLNPSSPPHTHLVLF